MKPRPKPQSIKEADANAYIDQGGSVAGVEVAEKEKTFTLRASPEILRLIALSIKKRGTHISKNSWLIETARQRLRDEGLLE
jgi:predicted HicB family RNase H-like nuclease